MAKVTGCEVTSHREKVTEEMRQKVLAALESIGETAASAAADVAPVDTGRLKGSISCAVVESELTAYIGTNVEYAKWHEFGTGEYASQGGGRQGSWSFMDSKGNWHRTTGVKAKHFLQYGAQSTWNQIGRDRLERILKED